MDMDARDFARNLMTTLTDDDLPTDDDAFDDEIMENLIYDPFESVTGLIALFYRNLWAMADLRETLKVYEDAAERDNGWIPCSERMPDVPEGIEDDECPEFNVTIKGADQATTLKCASDGTWFDDLGYTYDVIAWQPLPAPYNPHICNNIYCSLSESKDCPAADGCPGYEQKRTNFDMCCESMEAMAQIIDIAKIGWTKEQIMEWLQKEACEVPEPYSEDLAGDSITNAERIRSMSDEELAKILANFAYDNEPEVDEAYKWLQSEVEE